MLAEMFHSVRLGNGAYVSLFSSLVCHSHTTVHAYASLSGLAQQKNHLLNTKQDPPALCLSGCLRRYAMLAGFQDSSQI